MEWTPFDDHLTRLSRAERTAFVAALLAARGWDVEVDSPVILAVKGTQRTVVAVSREGLVPGHGLPAASIDVVVGVDSERTERLATAHDAHAWDARTLYNMARYGLDDAATRRLFSDHFGVTIDGVGPPTTPDGSTPDKPRRAERSSHDDRWPRLDTTRFGPLANGTVTRHARWVGLVLLAVALLVGPLLIVLGVTGMPAAEPTSDPVERSDTASVNRSDNSASPPLLASSPSPTPSRASEPTLVAPGLSASRIVDTPALARGHAAVLENQSFTMRITYTEQVDTETVGSAQEVVHVANGTVYRSRGTRSGNLTSSLVPAIARDIYADGESRYLRQGDGPLRVGGADDPGTGRFVDRSRALTVWYLSGVDSAVIEQVPQPDRVYYYVEIRGDSDRRIEDYRAIAVISNRGLVVRVDARYRLSESGRVATVSLHHVNVGNTTVERPGWMPPRNEATG